MVDGTGSKIGTWQITDEWAVLVLLLSAIVIIAVEERVSWVLHVARRWHIAGHLQS